MSIDFSKPSPVTQVDLAFPARGVELTPPYSEVPPEFKEQHNPWVQFINHWFSKGDPFETYTVTGPAEGIDGDEAIRHLQVVLGTYGTKHEHKTAGAAYLMSLWFESVSPKVRP